MAHHRACRESEPPPETRPPQARALDADALQDLVARMDDLAKSLQSLVPAPSPQSPSPQLRTSATPSEKTEAAEPATLQPSTALAAPHATESPAPAIEADSEEGAGPASTPAGPPAASLPAPDPLPPAVDVDAGDGSPLDSVIRALDSILDSQPPTKRALTTGAIMNRLYFTYKFPNYRNGTTACHKIPVKDVLHYFSSALLQNLDRDRWQSSEMWAYLQELSQTEFRPVAYKLSDFPVRLVPRKQMSKVPKHAPGQPAASRPTAGPAGGDDDGGDAGRRPIRHGKGVKGRSKSGLRPAAAKKRPRSQLEGASDSEGGGPRRSHYFSDEDEAMDDAVDDAMYDAVDDAMYDAVDDAMYDAVDDAVDATNDAWPPEDKPGAGSSGEEPIPIVIRAEKIPSTMPKGPHDTWLCDQEGCDYIVRGGDDCQARIQDHFRDHEQQLQRVSLAVTESRGGHLPIKYAYYAFFPPFLLLVDVRAPGESRLPAPPPPPRPSGPGSSLARFGGFVRQFRRSPHPVADKMHTLTWLQSLARQDQAHERQDPDPAAAAAAAAAAADERDRDARSPGYQTETDSVTVMGD